MRRFKDTLVGHGSALESALAKSNSEAEKIYKETTKRYEAMHSESDRAYFSSRSKMNYRDLVVNVRTVELYVDFLMSDTGDNLPDGLGIAKFLVKE
jgi:hypothetical protein